ncbi:MAG: DinB family protein [Candidatus Levybacteria bacterium]|nr:DinB family protein [Candidatus Levybacteria bacterium]
MNAHDIMMYGQKTFLKSLEKFPKKLLTIPGVSGKWSGKDVVAHIAAYEGFLVEALTGFIDGKSPDVQAMRKDYDKWNEGLVAKRSKHSFEELVAELKNHHEHAVSLISKIPNAKLRKVGMIPWYGKEYSLEDMFVYLYYGHKREHAAQLDLFPSLHKKRKG